MKKIFHYLFLFIILCVASCSKLPCNDDLDGQWQLMQINTKAEPSDSTYTLQQQKKNDRVYWCFQLDLLMVQETTETPWIYARFNHDNGYLDITSIYKNNRPEDSLITDPNTTMLEPIGISGNAETFKVEKLSRKEMILTTKIKQLVFKKL